MITSPMLASALPSHEYSYDEDLKIGERLLAKKGYYMNCLLAKGLYFEKEPIELLEVSHD